MADAVCRGPRWSYLGVNAENPNPVVELSRPLFLVGVEGKKGQEDFLGRNVGIAPGEEPLVETTEGLAMMSLSSTRDDDELPQCSLLIWTAKYRYIHSNSTKVITAASASPHARAKSSGSPCVPKTQPTTPQSCPLRQNPPWQSSRPA